MPSENLNLDALNSRLETSRYESLNDLEEDLEEERDKSRRRKNLALPITAISSVSIPEVYDTKTPYEEVFELEYFLNHADSLIGSNVGSSEESIASGLFFLAGLSGIYGLYHSRRYQQIERYLEKDFCELDEEEIIEVSKYLE